MACKSFLMDFAGLSHSLGARHFSFSGVKGFSSVSIDSRNVENGSFFIALSGAVTDGHRYIEAAFNAGAAGAMVELSKLKQFGLVEMAEKMGKELIALDNTLYGLQEAARIYLQQFPGLLKIGITGSAGKTTTKEIAAAIICAEKSEEKVIMSKGNLNSETGLPLSVFSIRRHHEVGVFELAMNRKGEMAELARILTPNIALITNIGMAHIGLLGSQDAIAKEKKDIFSCLTDDSVALIPKEDAYRNFLAENIKGAVRFYSADTFSEFEGVKSLGLEGSEICWAGQKIHFALPGKHCFADAMAAIAIAKEAGVGNDAIKRGLESVRPMFGRAEIVKGRATVIRDCYNASPESTAKALEFCDSLEWPGRRVYVMADMLELGDNSHSAHEKLGCLLVESKADAVFLFGKEIKAAAAVMKEKNRHFFHTEDIGELSTALDNMLQNSDLVLLKGSRGCALERLSSVLVGAQNTTEAKDGS